MIERERHDDLAILRMAHGKASAMDVELCHALRDAIADAAASDASALVLTGTGSIFSAGVDLVRLAEGGADYIDEFLPALDGALDAPWACDKPVVAAINGHAIAGGCVLAQGCDHRIMARGKGRIGMPELQVGVPFPPIIFEILRSAVPASRLREVVYLGRNYRVDDAVEAGLVNETVEPDVLLDRACEVARQLGAAPAESFRLTKEQVRGPARAWLAGEGAALNAEVRAAWKSDAVLEALRAYVAKTLGK